MFVIVGLGNPGREYAKTRHNVGFMTIDKIAERLNISVNKKGFVPCTARGGSAARALCLQNRKRL